ncbi:hypothetical protein BV25DRAFT_1477668 [Artomyces pyxidatus]|uniref:Uncharacterized protein n=1 Tax=Artomyces pyxidatus TaxID=48021 RepID=A0ACB8SM21_9AGAM|nr:hypothetical protein BV25DRAFT_1477668 [Artomyces pyxidatus]
MTDARYVRWKGTERGKVYRAPSLPTLGRSARERTSTSGGYSADIWIYATFYDNIRHVNYSRHEDNWTKDSC